MPDSPVHPALPLLSHHPANRADKLNFNAYARAIANTLSHLKADQTGLTIGIFGDWGSGKSTLLDLVTDELRVSPTKFLLVEFEAWKYGKPEEVWVALLRSVIRTVEDEFKWTALTIRFQLWWRRLNLRVLLYQVTVYLLRTLLIFLALLAALAVVQWAVLQRQDSLLGEAVAFLKEAQATSREAVILTLFLALVEAITRAVRAIWTTQLTLPSNILRQTFDQNEPLAVELFREDLSDLIQSVGKRRPIVVLIDDLDRAPVEQIVPVLEAIKHCGVKPEKGNQAGAAGAATPGEDRAPIAFVVAVDRGVIEQAILAHYEKFAENLDKPAAAAFAREYLEKIIQIPFELPPAPRRALESILPDLKEILPDELKGKVDLKTIFAQGFRGTPREVIQAYNTFRTVQMIVQERNLDQVRLDVLAVLILIRYLAPGVFERFWRYPELFFDLHAQASQTPNEVCSATEIEELLVLRSPSPTAMVETISRDDPILSSLLTAAPLPGEFGPDELFLHLTLLKDQPAPTGTPLIESPAALMSGDPTRIKFFRRTASTQVSQHVVSLMTILELETPTPSAPGGTAAPGDGSAEKREAPASAESHAEAEKEMVAALFALGRLGDPSAVEVVQQVIDQRQHYPATVVNRAVFALAHLAGKLEAQRSAANTFATLLDDAHLPNNQKLRVLRLLERILPPDEPNKPSRAPDAARKALAQVALRGGLTLLRTRACELAGKHDYLAEALAELKKGENEIALESYSRIVELSTQRHPEHLTPAVALPLIQLAARETAPAQESAFNILAGLPRAEEVMDLMSLVAARTEDSGVWDKAVRKMAESQRSLRAWQTSPWHRVQSDLEKPTAYFTTWIDTLKGLPYAEAVRLLQVEAQKISAEDPLRGYVEQALKAAREALEESVRQAASPEAGAPSGA